MTKKKKSFQDMATVTEPVITGDLHAPNDLRAKLEELKNDDSVIGYILRNTTSAAIDLKDPTRIIDYAILSSSALDASTELSRLFDLGEVKHMVVEGKNAKLLSFTVGENKISVFLEKDVDFEKILKQLQHL